ncbi:P-loop containing nucleoside triphosphate hydrolase protein [Flammula alnicola]|nr:P-loop containing nucleoside triphosphate hydrolase protein [Flammula alnicola]
MSPRPDFLRPLILSGPSGVGKSTLLQRLFAEFPDKFGFSVSHTTRTPRPGEVNGKQYHFENAFIEHAEFSGNFYGTSFETVRQVQQQGRRWRSSNKKTNLNPVYLFISPPSMSALRARLQQRGTESESAVQKRLTTALAEIEYAKEPNVHDLVIVNDDLDRAYELFKKVAQGEEIVGDTLPQFDD